MKKIDDITKRFFDAIKELGLTPYKVSKAIPSISEQKMSNAKNARNSISIDIVREFGSHYKNVNVDYILFGKLPILFDNDNNIAESESSNSNGFQFDNYRLIPLYSSDVVGGINNQESDTNGYITGYLPFVNAKKGDIAVPVTNDSMYPLYAPGCMVQVREIETWREYVEFGQVHIIELNDDRRLIKTIRKGSDKTHFLLVSENPKYDDTEIDIDLIRSVWLVLAKFQKNVM